ncbi:unnamed protein product [Closterium sp. NIES-54]
MYAVSDSAEGDCYLCVPPDPGIEAAALGASASAAPGTSESAASGSGMASRTLVSSLPRSLPPLPPGPAPTCVPCVEGRQRAARHSSEFPPTEAPLQTLHMDVWGPARVRGQGHECYFLLVVDDYSRYTTVFPLRSKGVVTEVLIDWICGSRQVVSFPPTFWRASVVRRASARRSRFRPPNSKMGLLSAALAWSWTSSQQQNGIAERRIGMVMDVTRTSMIHAAAPHFLWPFAVQYAAHQINLQPRVSLPETTPTLRWTGKVGDASVFRVWGSRAFVRDTSADKLSSRAVPCVYLGFPPDAPGWLFYHPTSRRVLSSQDVTFDESVSYYRLFPYRTTSLPPSPLFLAPGAPPVDPLPTQGPAPSGVSQVDPAEPVEVAVNSGAEPVGAGTGGAEPGVYVSEGAEPGGTEPERVEPRGDEPGGAETGGAEPERAASGGPPGLPSRREPLSPLQLREWYARHCRVLIVGVAGGAARGPGAVGGPTGAGAAGHGGACSGGTGAAGAGGAAGVGASGAGAVATGGASGAGAAGGTGAGGATGVVAGDPGAEGTGAVSAVSGGAARPRPYYVPLLQQVLGLPPSPGPPPSLLSPPTVQSQSQLQPTSPQPGPSSYSGSTRGLTERREPESRPVSPESRSVSLVRTVRAGRSVSRPRPPPVPGTHSMKLRPSTAPRRVPLPSPPASSLPTDPDPDSDSLRAASPTVTRFLATAVTDPLFESTATSSLVAELVDFAAACRLDFATSLVAESATVSVCPPSVGGDPDAPDISTPRSYAEAIEGPYSSQLQATMDAEMASWKSTGTYVDEVPPPGANIVSGMWIFRVMRPPGSPPVFKARYIARGFSQRQVVDFFQTFSPTPKMTTLWVLLHVAAQRDYELHSLDFSTAFLQGSLHEEIWLRRPPGFTGSFPAGT